MHYAPQGLPTGLAGVAVVPHGNAGDRLSLSKEPFHYLITVFSISMCFELLLCDSFPELQMAG